jgi:hypothetical protein
MSNLLMATIKRLRVGAIQSAHPAAEIPFGGFNQEMIMVIHQTIGIAAPLLLLYFEAQEIEKTTPIQVIQIDSLSPVPTCGHMIKGTLIF